MIIAPLLLRIYFAVTISSDEWWWKAFYYTPCRIDGLALGSLIAIMNREKRLTSKMLKPANMCFWSFLILFGFISIIDGGGFASGRFLNTIGISIIALASGCLILMSILSNEGTLVKNFLSNKILCSFGKYAYGLYLLNMPLRAIIRDVVYKPNEFWKVLGSYIPGQIIFYIISIPFIYLGAYFVFNVYERQFLKLKVYFK